MQQAAVAVPSTDAAGADELSTDELLSDDMPTDARATVAAGPELLLPGL